MKFTIKHGDIEKQGHAALIIGISENGELTASGQQLDKKSHGYLSNLLKKGEIKGKIGQSLYILHIPHTHIENVLLVGCGKSLTVNEREYRKIVISGVKALNNSSVKHAVIFLTELTISTATLENKLAWQVKQTAEACSEALYRFDQFKSEKNTSTLALNDVTIQIPSSDKKTHTTCQQALQEGLMIAEGVKFTKNLANLPSNICTPSYLAEQAEELAKEYKTITATILEEKDMAKLGMGAFLAVAKGSVQDAKLICLEYKGSAKKQAPIALIGKGITFDTGGISLKSQDSMVGMKYDMCGAATVLGTLSAVAALNLPLHVIGILATAENMPSGHASKPEDIVTTLSGQTVEIMNTDAEGRLVLCDALTYCERFEPKIVIDIATLTGAVVIALGHHATGLLSNDDHLAKELLDAGIESNDRAWQLPLWEEYQEQLKSPFADMSNIGGRAAGTITAACFLSRFAKKFKWAHLDVAGTAAMMGGNDRYATGRPVPLLMQFLLNRCKR